MFYLVGLGLSLRSISLESLDICRKADKVYLETYTVDFPYKIEKLEEVIGKKIIPISRTLVEEEKFVDEAEKKNIVLLVYGSPLIATTHVALLMRCHDLKIGFKVYHNSSIIDAVAETGLQVYKFGKTASMPAWSEKHRPDSFMEIIKDNLSIKAHSLILVDIGLNFSNALKQLEDASKKRKIELNKIIVCSQLGNINQEIFYDKIENLYGEEVETPYCFVIPADLHFLEQDMLNRF